MVKASLSYNPYLLETSITFNGCEPKINSSVEKYRAGNLLNWIAKLPGIFYNEMNGWDFELDFVGTKIDFEALQAAFDAAGSSRESVQFFHKYELGCVECKIQGIKNLLAWFKDNPNDRFDFEAFWQSNSTQFDSDSLLIAMQGPTNIQAMDEVTIENMLGCAELAQAVLENTPVLFYINEQNRVEFQHNLAEILKRPDVQVQQLFFCISPEQNRAPIERVIRLFGVEQPQIVDSPSDKRIARYFKVYPMTAYVQQVIRVLRDLQTEIRSVLEAENEQSLKINDVIHQKIDTLDEGIQKLKAASETIALRDNYTMPSELTAAKDALALKLLAWRKKKIKMTSDEEAFRACAEFTNEIRTFFNDYINQVRAFFQAAANEIDTTLREIYNTAEFCDNYQANQEVRMIDFSGYALPELASVFLALKDEQWEVPGDSLFSVFKNAQAVPKEPVRVVTYLYQEWRENAAQLISPRLDAINQDVYETLKDYYERVAEDTLGHLKTLVEEQTQIKDAVSAQLSDDERKLQTDNDWLSVLQGKLHEIERS